MLSTLQFGLGHVFIHTSSGVVNSLAQATPKDLGAVSPVRLENMEGCKNTTVIIKKETFSFRQKLIKDLN